MLWKTSGPILDLSTHAIVMGVLNVTADSFSDGGRFLDPQRAWDHAQTMADAGARILDIGGESTRPGATPVPEQEEMRRVLPIIERLSHDPRLILSIDTMKPAVARAAVRAGAAIINDVTGLRDPAMRDVVAETGAAAIAMHMQGTPADMQRAPSYDDVVADVREFFRQTFHASLRSGIDPMCLAFDPGIGFGKTLQHNLALLCELPSLRIEERPLVLGVSRKSFLGIITDEPSIEARHWPTVALSAYGRQRGASVLRVHDVLPNLEAIRATEALAAA